MVNYWCENVLSAHVKRNTRYLPRDAPDGVIGRYSLSPLTSGVPDRVEPAPELQQQKCQFHCQME